MCSNRSRCARLCRFTFYVFCEIWREMGIFAGVSLFIDFVELGVSIFYVFCGFLLENFKIFKRNFEQFITISKCPRSPQNTTHIPDAGH